MRRLVFVALVAACGGSDSSGPIPIDELEGAVVSAFCNLYVNCGMVEDQATCRSLYHDDIGIEKDLLAAVDAGKVIYHPDKARECLNGLGGTCKRSGAFGNEVPACDETFEGTVGAGGQCAMDEECISQNCDIPGCTEACCQGTCVGDTPPVRPRLGEACGAMTGRCVSSYCDTTTMTCTALRAAGAPCTSSSQCATGLCANQICTELPGPGEPCGQSAGSGLCDELGYTCSTTTMTCVAYGLSGDPCTSDSDCSPVYACGPAGTCQLGPRLGDPCTGECIDRSYCEATTMTCTAPQADGMPCNSNRQCASDYCDATGTCTTPPICI